MSLEITPVSDWFPLFQYKLVAVYRNFPAPIHPIYLDNAFSNVFPHDVRQGWDMARMLIGSETWITNRNDKLTLNNGSTMVD